MLMKAMAISALTMLVASPLPASDEFFPGQESECSGHVHTVSDSYGPLYSPDDPLECETNGCDTQCYFETTMSSPMEGVTVTTQLCRCSIVGPPENCCTLMKKVTTRTDPETGEITEYATLHAVGECNVGNCPTGTSCQDLFRTRHRNWEVFFEHHYARCLDPL